MNKSTRYVTCREDAMLDAGTVIFKWVEGGRWGCQRVVVGEREREREEKKRKESKRNVAFPKKC